MIQAGGDGRLASNSFPLLEPSDRHYSSLEGAEAEELGKNAFSPRRIYGSIGTVEGERPPTPQPSAPSFLAYSSYSGALRPGSSVGVRDRRRARVSGGTSQASGNSATWRLLDRGSAFSQSNGAWRIRRLNRDVWLYLGDPFHTILNWRLSKLLLLMVITYLLIILSFAFAFWSVSEPCGLDITSFQDAWYFSTQTIMTIGFGLPPSMPHSPYFNDCSHATVFVTIECILGVIADAVFMGLVFTRIQRGQTRATTVVFSDWAVIRRVRGRLRFQFQVCEMRKHQLVEAHVRCYCISRYIRPVSAKRRSSAARHSLRMSNMRLSKPNDELGGVMMLSLPNLCVHDIDAWSPLNPPARFLREVTTGEGAGFDSVAAEARTEVHGLAPARDKSGGHDPSRTYRFPEVMQRRADVDAGAREELTQAVPDSDGADSSAQHRFEEEALIRYLREAKIEIVVLLEGIDPATSYTVQARHSYTVDDILLHHDFCSCVVEDDFGAAIDFKVFHEVVRVPLDCDEVDEFWSDT